MQTRPRGPRMRISGTPGLPATVAVTAPSETDAIEARGAKANVGGAAPAELQSEVMQPALAAMKAMPDIDHAKVAALRDALARGELPFDPAKLAGLIERFHGSRG